MNPQENIAALTLEWWKGHVATYEVVKFLDGSELEHLVWGPKDGGTIYRADFYMHKGQLMITGDMYEATLSFNRTWKLKDVVSCDLYYFMTCLKAGPHGRDGSQWDSSLAESRLKELLSSELKENKRKIDYEAEGRVCKDPETPEDPSNAEWEACMNKHRAIIHKEREEAAWFDCDPYDACQSESDWHLFLGTEEASRLWDDPWDHSNIGENTAPCHLWQFHALKEAMKYLEVPA
jgi:hypothetical protein